MLPVKDMDSVQLVSYPTTVDLPHYNMSSLKNFIYECGWKQIKLTCSSPNTIDQTKYDLDIYKIISRRIVSSEINQNIRSNQAWNW